MRRPTSIFGLLVHLLRLKLAAFRSGPRVPMGLGACGVVGVLALSTLVCSGECPLQRVASSCPYQGEAGGVAAPTDADAQFIARLGTAIVENADGYFLARRDTRGKVILAKIDRRGRVRGQALEIGTDAEIGPLLGTLGNGRYVAAWAQKKRVWLAYLNERGRVLSRTSIRRTSRVLRMVAESDGVALFGTQRRRILSEAIWYARFDRVGRKKNHGEVFTTEGATTFDVAPRDSQSGYELVVQNVNLRYHRDPPELQRLVIDRRGRRQEIERLSDGLAWDIRVARGDDALGIFWQRPLNQRGICFGTHPSSHQATCETRLAMHPSLSHSTHGFGAAWSENAGVRVRVGTNESRISPRAGVHIAPNITRDGSGFVVAWEERIRSQVWMRRLRANGEAYGPARKVALPTP